MSDVAHDDPRPLARAIDLEICGEAFVEGDRIARRRRDARPRPDQRSEGAARRTDEDVLCLRADEVRLWLAARVCALERDERAGRRERPAKGKRVAAIEHTLAAAPGPFVK